ncbi:MAG TPA: LysR family transcriptional regulator [Ramlibacter sp.]|nr:LysR family transcriptional regulator [Ramlibacter sp.]
MDLRQLSSFVGIAESGSLTRASTKVWRSQSALSRQLQELEQELGVALFERQARGLQLTDAGRWVLERSRQLLKDADALKANAAAIGTEPTGVLTVGAPPSLRPMLVAGFAAAFTRAHPKVRLQLREGTSRSMRDALARGDLDLAILSTLEPVDEFRRFPLLDEAVCLVGPPQARLSMRKPTPVSALKDRPLVLTPYPNSLRQIVDTTLADLGVASAPVAEADMVAMMLDLVRRGVGFTVLAYCAVHEGLTTHYVSASPLRGLRIAWVVCQSRERPETAAIRAARQALFETARAQLKAGVWKTAREAG